MNRSEVLITRGRYLVIVLSVAVVLSIQLSIDSDIIRHREG
jgi:hypothetical protein